MSKGRHSPVRTCLGCMRREAQSAMLRIAIVGGKVVLDPVRAVAGRGGYIHRSEDCLERFVKSKNKVFRSLGRPVEKQQRIEIAELIRPRLDRRG